MSENASVSDNDMINHGVPTDKLGKGNKQCRFRGCKLLAVKNAACDQHETIIKADNAQKRKRSNARNKENSGNPFAQNKTDNSVRLISFYKDIVIPGMNWNGRIEQMTSASRGVYKSLKSNGVALIKSAFVFEPQIIKKFKDKVSTASNGQLFETLFTSFYADGRKTRLLDGTPNRYIANDKTILKLMHDDLKIDQSLINILDNEDFPVKHKPVRYTYSVLKSDPLLCHPQEAHCDSETEGYYDRRNSFRFSCLIGIEEFTFLNMRILLSNVHFKVMLRMGDVLFFRNDIAHGASDNLSDFTHFRIHCFIDAKEYTIGDKGDTKTVMATKFVYNQN